MEAKESEWLPYVKKLYAKEFDSNFDDYRDINEMEKVEYFKNKLNILPSHKELSKLDLNKTQMDSDAASLFPSAMWDQNSVYYKIETGYAFQPQMNDVFVYEFNDQTSNHDGNDSAFFKKTYYNPPNLIIQHVPVKEKVIKKPK